jgi:hypothetical protein
VRIPFTATLLRSNSMKGYSDDHYQIF